MIDRPAALLALLGLAGCTAEGGRYPSLAARPVEGRSWAEPAPAPPTPLTADPALDAQIAATTAALAASGRDFDVADRQATPLVQVARRDAAGSERWVAAQSALAQLDAHRATASELATTLEQLAGNRAQALLPDYPTLEAARANAAALLAREAARIGALQATIRAG